MVSDGGAVLLNTELLGDSGACRQIGEWMTRVSTRVFDTAILLNRARSRIQDCWSGDAATAFDQHLGRGEREADQLSEEIEHVGFALIAFSAELDAVARHLQQAREVAAEAGLAVTAQGIEPPPEAVLPAGPTTPERIAEVESYLAQARAWNDAIQLVSYARGLELTAHQRLARETATPKRFFDSVRSTTGFIASGATPDSAEGAGTPNSRYRRLSRQHANQVRDLARQPEEKPTLSRT